MDEFDVAVVIFCRAQGVDEWDAENRAEAAVAAKLRDTDLVGLRLPGQMTKSVAVVPLGQAVAAGYLKASPSAKPYKMAGFSEPRKGVES
jgi:hypothetical protein